ncbi:DUF3152 domain-containing protein [Streptomyces sp. NPDC056061]|uniref:DUF3152 domain-containing protein n=1 Tax=Streptomyces sp. NPDC056061 TaxID=3345700 RepID=UPI0035D9ECCD
MGRHSRKGPKPAEPGTESVGAGIAGEDVRPGPGSGRRRRSAEAPAGADGHAAFEPAGHVRSGHPEQREPGGGWGAGPQAGPPADGGRPAPRQSADGVRTARRGGQATLSGPLIPGPRREFVEAFDVPSAPPAPRGPVAPAGPPAAASDPKGAKGPDEGRTGGEPAPGTEAGGGDAGGNKGRTFTGIAAVAVTTVLAVIVAGQVAQDDGGANGTTRAAGVDRDRSRDASRSDDRATPKAAPVRPLSYEQKMAKAYPLAAKLRGSGKFDAVPGTAKAPGRGHKYRYRIDVEQGLGLDAELFARAVQETLNDDRSWAHDGAMTFERVSSGDADFVITLASPGTTAVWCRKSGLDTTEDNVSCDSAATERVMINAYRWAQGSSTFGPDKLFAYRQMLINHEVGHRLGHNHVSCRTPGELAPVMQQQTKSLDIDDISCRPNPWMYPSS